MPRIANRPARAGLRGFTLVELMVTVAVIGIVAVVAVPGMQALVSNSRLTGMTGEMTTSLQLARSEAIRRNAPVTVCGSTDGSTCATTSDWAHWIVIGPDIAAGEIDVIRDNAAPASVQISGPDGGIRFNPSGLTDAPAALTVCAPNTSLEENQRIITVLVSGSIVTTSGTCS